MSHLNDPALVRDQYASEENLRARQSIYGAAEGEDPREVAFAAVAEAAPGRLLEVGGGQGELAGRFQRELGASVSFVDSSERMVELARARGLDAVVGDVQSLPFEDDSFDVAVAAWMLYHVPDVDRGLRELARVLKPGGRLVAVTNGVDHLCELRELFPWTRESPFSRENGAELLGRRFASVERRDVDGWVSIETREAVLAYRDSISWVETPEPKSFEVPLRVRRASSIFVAENPA